MLNNWNLKNPGGKESAAARGTAVHQACEDYIRGKEVSLPEAYEPFWNGLSKHLDRFDSFLWSEKPLNPEWNFTTGKDGISRVWSHEFGYCGCPDLIAVRNGVVILGDYKTSNGPYCRYFPKEKGDRGQLHRLVQAQQVRASARCLLDCRRRNTGPAHRCRPDPRLHPEIDQCFTFQGDELERFKTRWLQRVRKYRDLKEEEAAAEKEEKEVAA